MDDLEECLRRPDSRGRTSCPSIDNRYISGQTSEAYKQGGKRHARQLPLLACAVRRQNTGPKGAGGFLHSRNECYQDTCPIVKDSACVGVCRHTLQPLMRDALVLLGLSLENIDKVQLAFCLLSVPHMSKDVNPHLLRSDLGERFESRQKDHS